jgi:hypothetical protein
MRIQILLGTAVLLLALGVGIATAGNSRRIGTAGATELLIPNSARGLAMGGSTVAEGGGIDMLYYNPAAIAPVRNVEAYFSNLSYIGDMNKKFIGVAAKTSFGSIAVAVDVLSIGDIEETTEEAPDGTGRIFSPNFTVLNLSYGRYLTDAVTIGLSAKLISEQILQVKATGVGFDAGIQYRPGPRGVAFGLAIKNFGPNMTFSGSDFESFHQTSDNPQAAPRSLSSLSAPFELPSYFEVGGRYEYQLAPTSTISGTAAFSSNNFGYDEYKFGVEYGWKETLFLRLGEPLSGDADYLYGTTFGAGFAIPLGGQSFLHADYTMRIVKDYFDNNQMLALRFEF